MTIDTKYLENELKEMKKIADAETQESEGSSFEEIENEIQGNLSYLLSQARVLFCEQCLTETNLENVKKGAEIIKEMSKIISVRFEYRAD